MSTLEELKDYIDREYKNICKSKYRARTLDGILTKKQLLTEALKQFTSILQSYEHRLSTLEWNRLTDDFEFVKTRVELSLKILDGTVVIREKEPRNILHSDYNIEEEPRFRRNSDYCIEIIIPENTEREYSTLEDSEIWENLPFSSSFIQSTKEEKSYKFPEHINYQEEENVENSTLTKNLTENLDLDNTSFQELIEKLKNQFIQNSFYFDRRLMRKKRRMAEFPTEKAIQCIPEFRGVAAELDAFLYAADYFANLIKKGESHAPLIQVVLLKLKGPAAAYFKRIKGDKWPEVKEKLEKEFGTNVKLEELFQKIETLEQGANESFQSYKDRVLTLKEYIDEYEKKDKQENTKKGNSKEDEDDEEEEEEESFALRSLRIHFLGGLKNRNLKNLAKIQKTMSFEELLEYLEEECIDVEQIEDIEKRLQSAKLGSIEKSIQKQNDYQDQPREFQNRLNKNFSQAQGNRYGRNNPRNYNQQNRPSNWYGRNYNFTPQYEYQNYNRNNYFRNPNNYQQRDTRFPHNNFDRNWNTQFPNNNDNFNRPWNMQYPNNNNHNNFNGNWNTQPQHNHNNFNGNWNAQPQSNYNNYNGNWDPQIPRNEHEFNRNNNPNGQNFQNGREYLNENRNGGNYREINPRHHVHWGNENTYDPRPKN